MAVGATLAAPAFWLALRERTPDRSAAPLDPIRTPPTGYAWTQPPEPAFPVPPYARYLNGVRIVLDPGHGGRADWGHWKRGPTGLQEAEVNLRVAQFLRDFLQAVDADVILTREADEYLDPDLAVDNRKRIALANESRADLFISIHHNGADKPETNYTAIFYRGEGEWSAASRCAARHVLAGLNDALRLEQHLPCALLSDELLHNNGLLVLREARVPAILAEASFHSNPAEEVRLRDPVYNRREAYGYFVGLARWAQAGLPRVGLASPPDGRVRAGQTVMIALDDGLCARGGWGADRLRLAPDSLIVRLNDRPVDFVPDYKSGRLKVTLPNRLPEGRLRLFVDFQNVFGQHVLHPLIELNPGAKLSP